ncbi:MAG TPA: hypothetical protein ENI33_04380 [Thermoplasmatales archaeon]|nr:hypothetical protein [Thermoplasmatales archaeon]
MSLRNKIIILILIFLIAIRAYNIENPFSTNGIDEGIHLLQAKMINEGYDYYKDLNGDQSPLAILIFSMFAGNVMICRYISYSIFLISTLFLFLIAKKFGKDVAFTALLIISLDFTLLKESRLASLDLFSASMLCFSSFFFINYIERENTTDIILSSLFLSLSTLSKIVPSFLILFILFYIFILKKKVKHGILYIISFFIPLIFILLIFSPDELIEGILLKQTHRGFDLYSKLSIFVFISSCFIYLYSIKRWDIKNEKIMYMLGWVSFIFFPILFQGRTFQHHFVYISYPLAILSSVVLHEKWNKRKIILTIFVIFNLFLAIFFVFSTPHDLAYDVGREIKKITEKKDTVISGNPLINVVANRLAPPNLTNLARYHYPQTTLNDIIYWLEKNETKVIVLYYHLYEIDGLKEYLENSTKWHFYKKMEGRGQILFNGIKPEFSEDRYEIYIKSFQ